jgi:hypothetical protein
MEDILLHTTCVERQDESDEEFVRVNVVIVGKMKDIMTGIDDDT